MFYLSVLLFLTYCAPSRKNLTFAQEGKDDSTGSQDMILCRKCGSDIADASYLFHKHSPGAVKSQRMKLFGHENVTVQTLVNPFGVQFDVITVEKARCQHMGSPQGGDSWFPGYEWRICICPQCGHHLGWTFQHILDTNAIEKSTDKEFHGLVLSSILEENFTDSLIMMPKIYKV